MTPCEDTPPLLVSQAEACRLLSIERTTLWRTIRRGDLQQVHLGRRALVTRASIDALIEKGGTGPAANVRTYGPPSHQTAEA
jgi:excisionase family DNA binding protein